MLEVDPKKRIKIGQILHHPWLKSFDIDGEHVGIEIFTNHERNKIEQGFVFRDDVDTQYLSIDAALEDDRLDIHDFNISLSSTQNPELRNLSSRSDPLGP